MLCETHGGLPQIQNLILMIFAGMSIKISDWEEIFLKSIMLSYHLNDILIKVRDGFIEAFGDNPIPIKLPKKGYKGKFLNAFVFPEYDKGDSGRVRFSYLLKKNDSGREVDI